MYHWLPGCLLDAMRPEGCAIQYAAGGLDALLDRRRPVVARATAVWAACSSKPGGTAGLWHRCRTGRDSGLSCRCVSASSMSPRAAYTGWGIGCARRRCGIWLFSWAIAALPCCTVRAVWLMTSPMLHLRLGQLGTDSLHFAFTLGELDCLLGWIA